MPTVSVIIPAYNAEAFIGDSLTSILNQSVAPYEIIVIEDASTDGTASVVKKFESPLIVYRPISHVGLAKARRAGMEIAKGDIIAFCDADDVWHPQKIQKQLDALEGYDLVHSDAYLFKDQQRGGQYWSSRNIQPSRGGSEILPRFFDRNQIIASSVMFRRTALDKVLEEGIDHGICLDLDYALWLRLLESGAKFNFINEPLLDYRIHENQLSQRSYIMAQCQEFLLKNFLLRNTSFVRQHPILVGKKLLKTYLKLYWESWHC